MIATGTKGAIAHYNLLSGNENLIPLTAVDVIPTDMCFTADAKMVAFATGDGNAFVS